MPDLSTVREEPLSWELLRTKEKVWTWTPSLAVACPSSSQQKQQANAHPTFRLFRGLPKGQDSEPPVLAHWGDPGRLLLPGGHWEQRWWLRIVCNHHQSSCDKVRKTHSLWHISGHGKRTLKHISKHSEFSEAAQETSFCFNCLKVLVGNEEI